MAAISMTQCEKSKINGHARPHRNVPKKFAKLVEFTKRRKRHSSDRKKKQGYSLDQELIMTRDSVVDSYASVHMMSNSDVSPQERGRPSGCDSKWDCTYDRAGERTRPRCGHIGHCPAS